MKSPEQFPGFFKRVLELAIPPLANTLSPKVRKYVVLFLIHVFQSIENPLIRGECMMYVERHAFLFINLTILKFFIYLI